MNFSQLQCFVTLVEMGSFTEAALTLGLTQSTVSHALTDFENDLGVALLERNRKGVVALTSTGKKIIPHVLALLAQAGAIEQEAKAARSKAAGKLRLGCIFSFCPDLLASLLTCFQAAHPDIEVVLFEGSMQEVVEWIGSGIVDIGFVLHPARGIESTLITTDELCALVPSEHHLHTHRIVTMKDVCANELIMAKTGCAFQVMEMAGIQLNKIKPHIRYQASDSVTILAMVREGLGITLLPRMMLPKRLEGVVALQLDPPQPLQIGLAVRSREIASRNATLFVQTALAWSQKQPTPLSRTR